MRPNSLADSCARNNSSGSGPVPRKLNARHANRMVSRTYISDELSGCRPFSPGRAPMRSLNRNPYSKAACGRLSAMYGHIASIETRIASPLSCQTHAGRALGFLGRVGPYIFPPAISWHRNASTSSVVDIEMTACQFGLVRFGSVRFMMMYEPSPSSNPARYAASHKSIRPSYMALATKPSYWKTAVENLRRLDAEMSLPSLFDEAAS